MPRTWFIPLGSRGAIRYDHATQGTTPPDTTCVHRGDYVRDVPCGCGGAGGKVVIPAYQCRQPQIVAERAKHVAGPVLCQITERSAPLAKSCRGCLRREG